MLELGPEELALHRQVGAEAAAAGVHRLLCFGPRARELAAGAAAAGLPGDRLFHTEDVAALAARARAGLGAGDVLLVKGSRGMRLERLVEALRESGR